MSFMSCLYKVADRYKTQKAVNKAVMQNYKPEGAQPRVGSSPTARTKFSENEWMILSFFVPFRASFIIDSISGIWIFRVRRTVPRRLDF